MPHAESPDRDILSFNGEKLYVNDGLLLPGQVGPLKESSLDLPIEELRRRYDQDGYLFLKGLLPRDDVLKARAEYFRMLAPSGVLKPGTTPVEGIFDDQKDASDFPGIGAGAAGGNGKPGGESAEKFVDLALEAHYAEWYKEQFCKHPVLKDAVARISGWGENTFAVRRSLLRNNTPGNKAIGVHYDQIFLRHGEPTSFTAWVPMGDIGLTGGGLIYLENGEKCIICLSCNMCSTLQDICLAVKLKRILPEKHKNAACRMRRRKMLSIRTCFRPAFWQMAPESIVKCSTGDGW